MESALKSEVELVRNCASIDEFADNIYMWRDLIAEKSTIIIRGLITPAIAAQIVANLETTFISEADLRVNPEVTPSRENYQRLDLGEYGGVARFMRTFFQFGWNEDKLGAGKCFTMLTQMRNLLMGLPENYLLDSGYEGGAYNAARIIQYPSGGGFMAGHKDRLSNHINLAHQGFRSNFVALLSLGTRDENFEQGGAWINTPQGHKLDVEGILLPGDIILYDQLTEHGVAGIDTHKPIDTKGLSGRLVALATPYPFQ